MPKLNERELELRRENYQQNKAAYKARSKAWKKANPEKKQFSNRKNFIKRTYGLSWEEYELMYNKHEGRCAVCKIFLQLAPKQDDRDQSACIDHNHSTGEIRGLLCRRCNIAIGFFDENTDRMLNAAAYIKSYAITD